MTDYPLPYRIHLVPITGPSIESKSWTCGNCKMICYDYDQAFYHCRPRPCPECSEEILPKSCYTLCDSCRSKKELERKEAAFAKMTLVEHDGGPLWDDNTDRFFVNEEDAFEYYWSEKDSWPEYFEACDVKKVSDKFDSSRLVDGIVEQITDEFENPEDVKLVGIEELDAAVEEFLKKQTVEFWEPNKKKVKLELPEEP